MARYVLALDQGTTSSRAILFDRSGNAAASAAQEFKQHYPQAGWVEHDAEEIWASQRAVALRALAQAKARAADVHAIGITNQRETVVLWERRTSRPVYPAIVWQCRRTAAACDQIRRQGFDRILREKTGLVADAYFSATKIAWLLENVPGARERAERGDLACGTIDTWLLWKLTTGRVHATDVSNASRTMLFNLRTLAWDDEILRYFRIPRSILPEVKSSSEVFGETDLLGGSTPVAGVAGDQQASLFGHRCFGRGDTKNTYGTGCFLLMNTGAEVCQSNSGLISTVAWQRNGETRFALEGSIFIAGAAIQWLRDEMAILPDAEASEAMAQAVSDNGGVYFVPAFVGLGAPHWDPYARGTIVGLTRGSNRNHLVRAALESMAYQTRAVAEAMAADSGLRPRVLCVDGGATRNNFLCQFQADILGIPVERHGTVEATALGAAYLAGLATGFWKDERDFESNGERPNHDDAQEPALQFEPRMEANRREDLYQDWARAVERAKGWVTRPA
ncbi:MAG: glycerol kinase GlpK [Terriglobia bacterium]